MQEEGRKEGIWLLDGQLCNLREGWERVERGIEIWMGDGRGRYIKGKVKEESNCGM